ncbi:NAD-dependent 15-hydroxyprostaglandin dehydrogenase [Fonsecaea pedrosoi]|nr:NAD-dependent 15-hydroxyprostaglandin dehydrogenase [Fonsecaea pedrosoi]
MDASQIRGKGAIVTGAGSGINLSFAQALHRAGCSVLIMDIALHKDAVAWMDTISNPQPSEPKVIFYKSDVSKWSELEKVFDVFADTIGGVPYIVCPGAGVYEPSHNSFWKDNDTDNHYKVLDINLLAPIKMSRIAIRRMLAADAPGIICCVSSIGAQKASIVTPLYQASKHGISSFVRCMADLHKLAGIRVVGVAPGIIRTPLYSDHPEAGKFVDPEKDFMLSPDEVARGMMAVCLDPKYPPGTILEVADVDNWREVKLLNDPGPQGRAILASKKQDAVADVIAFIEKDKQAKPNGTVAAAAAAAAP